MAHNNSKVKDLDALAQLLSSRRSGGGKVVLCHGVFDPLHIGHIRHFEEARGLGDILVVTVTPDAYVNKGSHRPVFTGDLRAEAIAALQCVDYVAVNRWPTAVETIGLLRPHVYVKGPDYQDPEQDPTGGIKLEEAAVKSVGGKIAFTNDITFSSSALVNRHLPVFSEEVRRYLAGFTGRYSSDEVLGYLDRIRPLKVLVVGEAIIDEYQYCEAMGKSSKEPMLAVKQLAAERFAGGILAVGNHVANFCDNVGLITFLGETNSHEGFIREHLNGKIASTLLYRKGSPTIVKRRFIEEYFFTKLLEVYEIQDSALDGGDNRELCSALADQVPRYDVVIVVDFGHGMLSEEAVDILCSKSWFLAVNAQSNAGNLGYQTVSRYHRADFVSMAETEIRLETRNRTDDLRKLVPQVSELLDCNRVIVTRGNRGCLCYSPQEGFADVPAFAGRIVDRTGAGDAFLSVAALCLARNAPIEVAGFIGNVVGAQAVATVGNRHPVERVPLIKHIVSLMK